MTEKLKAKAFDLMVQIEKLQRELQLTNQEIFKQEGVKK